MYFTCFFLFAVVCRLHANTVTRREGGPECPRFDYEYKVIERLVHLEDRCERFERQQDVLENKNAELAMTVEEQRREIERLRRHLDRSGALLSVLLTRREDGPECPRFDYEYRVIEKLIHLEELVKLVDEQRKEIDFLRSQSLSESPVVVSQIQESHQQTLTNGQTMVFSNVIANIGNAYDTHLGHFEAPVNGTYLFSVTICMNTNSHVSFAVMREGQQIGRSFAGNYDWSICGSGTTATYMSAKEKVWVKISYVHTGRTWNDVNAAKSSFTGVLLKTYTRN